MQPAPLPPGFVPPFEIMRTVRAAGFDPLTPPLREGTTYVLRATDFRGILMRVVVDARTGAIRDANRILPGPGSYDPDGELGMMAPPYAVSPDDMPPPYGPPPPDYDDRDRAPSGAATLPAQRQPAPRQATHATAPPLPRPRPAEIAADKPAALGGKAEVRSHGLPASAAMVPATMAPTTSAAPISKTPTPVTPLND